LLAQEPDSIHKFAREWQVDANRFPISQTMTGVVLELEPGGLRELHWHPNADEWQYIVEVQRFHVRFARPLPLNTGEYQAIDLSQWTAATPTYLLADHFGKPEDVFARFPKERAFISPPDRRAA
jgi:oxalate decarboxylase